MGRNRGRRRGRGSEPESSVLAPVTGTYIGTVGLTEKQKREQSAILKKYGIKELKPKNVK